MPNLQFNNPLILKRLVLVFIALALCWFWYSNMMLQHLWDSPFRFKGADPTYWIMSLTGLPELILYNKTSAGVFSVLMFISILLAFVFAKQRVMTIVAGGLLLLYQVLFNYKLGYHTHHLYGLHFALLPFYFKVEYFYSSARFARILACLTYLLAGGFKLMGKAWMYPDSFSNTLQNQHAAYFYFNPDSMRTEFAMWMSGETYWAYFFFLTAMVLQISFLIGLFTRKVDIYLAIFILLFHAMDWFLMNLGVFMCMTVMVYLFLLPKEDQLIAAKTKFN